MPIAIICSVDLRLHVETSHQGKRQDSDKEHKTKRAAKPILAFSPSKGSFVDNRFARLVFASLDDAWVGLFVDRTVGVELNRIPVVVAW